MSDHPASGTRFHLTGVGLLAVLIAGFWLATLALSFASAACPPGHGRPMLLHVGVAVAGTVVTAVPAFWWWLARRRGRWWLPWGILTVVVGCVSIAAAVGVHVTGCPFTF